MEKLVETLSNYFNVDKNIKIENVCMDSRKISKNSLFLAINSGNSYVDEAIENGASFVIADNYLGNNEKVLKVENTVSFMQELAKKYRENLNVKIIAITGSNGKTTTKDILYTLLSTKYITKKNLGNYNNHIGLPYTILTLQSKDEYAILEMGMSDFGEIDLLGQISKPDFAIITNIGESHLEFLKTKENIFKAKTEILKYVSKENVVVYGDDDFLSKTDAFKVGFSSQNDCVIEIEEVDDEKSKFRIGSDNYEINLVGKHNIINASLSIALSKKIGLETENIKEGLFKIKLSDMRFQKIQIKNTLYINDAYNASPTSMRCSLQAFDEIYNNTYKIVVLGDMLELGDNSIELHKEILKYLHEMRVDEAFLYGDLMKQAMSQIDLQKINVSFFKNKEDIKEKIKGVKEEKVVFLKASRGMRLEEVIDGK